MYIELIDLLRCPKEHSDSWLVAAFNRMDGRFVIEGKLGCPVCSATYKVRDGIADLTEGESEVSPGCTGLENPDEQGAVRAAALLGLTKPNTIVVLAGDASSLAHQVSDIAEARIIALNSIVRIEESEKVAMVLSDQRLPFAPGSIDGIMLDKTTKKLAKDTARVLRQGGRLVAPAATKLPAGFRELARDDEQVVAESVGELITLTR